MPISPSTVRATRKSAEPANSLPSGETTWTSIGTASASLSFGFELLGLLHRLVDAADHVERLLGKVVQLALDQHLEASDRVLHRHVLAGDADELLGNVERLRQEPLDLAGPGDDELVLLRQLIHAQDGDDVLQVRVALQDPLDGGGDVVVLLADEAG